MITVVDGLQGSGKTYRGAYEILHNKNKYYQVFTNIDEYKFDDYVKPLKFSSFLEIMAECYQISKDESKTDQDILTYLYSIDFLNTDVKQDVQPNLIVLDEAHNYFDVKNDLLIFIVTYHRHFFVDFILLTVDANLFHFSYRRSIQKILRAVPSDKQFINNIIKSYPKLERFRKLQMKYQRHIKLPIQDGKFGTFVEDDYIPAEKAVFDTYNSGDKVRSPYAFKKYIYIALLSIISGIGLIVLLFNNFLSPTQEKKQLQNKIQTASSPTVHKTVIPKSLQELTYIKLNCIVDNCINDDFNIDLNIDDLNITIYQTKSKILTIKNHSNTLAEITLLASEDFKKLFQGANNVEEKGFSILGT